MAFRLKRKKENKKKKDGGYLFRKIKLINWEKQIDITDAIFFLNPISLHTCGSVWFGLFGFMAYQPQ